jgi:hypothetical protein
MHEQHGRVGTVAFVGTAQIGEDPRRFSVKRFPPDNKPPASNRRARPTLPPAFF